MRVAVLTSVETGFASLCLPPIVERSGAEIALVMLADGPPASRWRRMRQILGKTRRIGLLGAINGLRMRRWYGADVAALLSIEPIETVARRLSIPFERTPGVNSDRTIELLRGADVDLGLSLGNAWISPRVFELPRAGMLNVHHELLPEFQGAQSVVWSLHEGRRTTGYTIHRVSRGIDEGAIVDRRELPISFRSTLAETVTATYALLLRDSAVRLAEVVRDFPALVDAAQPQSGGRRFTTPAWRAFRRIRREHDRLRGPGVSSNA